MAFLFFSFVQLGVVAKGDLDNVADFDVLGRLCNLAVDLYPSAVAGIRRDRAPFDNS